ncbi:MAG: hypothetical protein WAU58_08175 [Terriglobales bacterium]|jgi:hypothetical protein
MSISGIFSSSFSNNQISSQYQLTNSEFQQLGQDLATGNLSSAQSDFAILQQAFMQPVATASSASNPLAQAFQQLSSDLKSGNLTAAQKDYSTIQQDMKSQFSGHHHHHVGSGLDPLNMVNQSSPDVTSTLAQSNATTAQQTYAGLAQQLQQYALGDSSGAASVTSLTNPISFMA